MATLKSLASMSLEALVKLRDDIIEVLEQRAEAIQRQLSLLAALASRGKRSPTLRRGKLAHNNRGGKRNARSRGGNRERQMATAVSRSGKSAKKATKRPASAGKTKLKGAAKRANAEKQAAKQIARVEPRTLDVAAAQSSSPQSSSEA